MTSISWEYVSGIYYLMEDPRVMVKYEEHSGLQEFVERYDLEEFDYARVIHYGDQEPLLLEIPLKDKFMITNETVEHIPSGPANR
jgi:hypothetical protein